MANYTPLAGCKQYIILSECISRQQYSDCCCKY